MYEFIDVAPINPRASSRYREAMVLSRASTDAKDAHLLCDFAIRHQTALRIWKPASEITRRLAMLTEQRRKLVDQRTAFTHQLRAAVEMYFPQALEWFGDETSRVLRAALVRWPTLGRVERATAEQLTEFFRKNRCRKVAARVEALLAALRSAVPMTSDRTIVDTHSMYTRSLIAMIDAVDTHVGEYDEEIERVWSEHPDREIFDSVPGAGPAMAPRLAAAFGTDRARYSSATEMQCYSGIAPVVEQSGKQRLVHARRGFPAFLHQTFHEFAQSSLPHSPWARAVYREQIARGAKHHMAVRAVAFRWTRILFRLWQDRVPYDESKHLAHLLETNSPIALKVA
jgi:transposase